MKEGDLKKGFVPFYLKTIDNFQVEVYLELPKQA